ncbi:ARM repeat-containing protein [Lindgomyces ingoldianus]|uniref:ARM repeat-containing protein n=1 Tax=Lindgomyces ingoldianus TaxID=673940 RepID=A0ACB6QZ69_9PLEO|nr:ARM repeat-containing protein [Lindgomyces ingoldianus]KAF2471863.1 ARM repeat-containing protein [Lindgomyces ingoldianus]
MADQEEDFSSLPLPDRFIHKNWKVRKEGYEAAAKEFDIAPSEADPVVRQFIQDANIWKGVVGDSNVAAQQEGLGALCSFLQIAGTSGCTRTRNITITTIAEKGLPSTRPAAKQKSLEALLLYVELDKADPVIEELIPLLSHKQPKIIAATLDALAQIYHVYGCKTVEPKPVLKVLPKVFGHADKNVRAKAQELTVEFYRWLKEGMKPLFWNDLKPVQQQDLDKLFEKVKNDPPPKQERLLRSQQAVKESAAAVGGDDDVAEEEEEDVVIDLEPEYEAVDVLSKIPKDYTERLASSKWKDRKEALDEVHKALDYPKIAEGHFDELVRGFAKCMKDANIAVVSTAANCVELLAKGLRRSFAKYRSIIMNPMMERLKEKKQAVTDAIGGALDAVFASTSFQDCLEEILEFLKHKNPQVKLESTRFLIRCLKTTRDAPSPAEVKAIADAATKLLTESQEVQRSAGAEVLGTLWKIMGDRIMNAHLDGLDEIRKTKIKEYYDSAEVRAKYKPKPVAPPKAAAPPAGKRPMPGKRPPPGGVKRPTPPAAAPPPPQEEPTAPLAPKPTSRPGASKLAAPKSGLAAPSRLGGLKKPGSGMAAASPRRPVVSPPLEEAPPPPQPRLGLAPGRGLAGRPLGKLHAEPSQAPMAVAPVNDGLGIVEKAELADLRSEVEQLRRHNEEIRAERTKLTSQIHELQNQNAQLIEDHTRDVLSIKAKETQLVRARSDNEAAEQTVLNQRREIDRLKRELSRQVRATSPAPLDVSDQIYADTNANGGARFVDSGYGSTGLYGGRNRGFGAQPTSPVGEGKENMIDGSLSRPGSTLSGKLSPLRAGTGSTKSSLSSRGGRMSPPASTGGGQANTGAESWKRAAEVTQNLKQRIEMMKAKQGIGRPQQ